MKKTFLGTNITHLREQRKMSQEQLAHLVGVEIRFLRQWENGIEIIHLIQLLKLSKTLLVTMDDLINKDLRRNDNIEAHLHFLNSKMYEILI